MPFGSRVLHEGSRLRPQGLQGPLLQGGLPLQDGAVHTLCPGKDSHGVFCAPLHYQDCENSLQLAPHSVRSLLKKALALRALYRMGEAGPAYRRVQRKALRALGKEEKAGEAYRKFLDFNCSQVGNLLQCCLSHSCFTGVCRRSPERSGPAVYGAASGEWRLICETSTVLLCREAPAV